MFNGKVSRHCIADHGLVLITVVNLLEIFDTMKERDSKQKITLGLSTWECMFVPSKLRESANIQ